jgi:ATP-dependent Clp protease adaptor protein ClpS
MATKEDFGLDYDLELDFPSKYKVYLLNDDYTPMDFVVDILMNIFHKSYEEAEKIMLEVHKKDKGLCGIYTYEIAETKVSQVIKNARDNGYPLKAIMEEE